MRFHSMRPRLKAPAGHPAGFGHCISRVVNRDFVLGELEKEKFIQLMRQYEKFCGVRILSFCLLSNHFHLLLEVPTPPGSISDDELLEGCSAIYGPLRLKEISHQL